MKLQSRSKMGWFWFAIAIATLLTFAALVREGTVKLPFTSPSDAPAASDTADELTTTAEPELTTEPSIETTADTSSSQEPTLTTAQTEPTQAAEIDPAAVRSIVLDKYANKYHLDENCVAAGMIDEDNREVVQSTVDDVKAQGYIPCDMCAAGN